MDKSSSAEKIRERQRRGQRMIFNFAPDFRVGTFSTIDGVEPSLKKVLAERALGSIDAPYKPAARTVEHSPVRK